MTTELVTIPYTGELVDLTNRHDVARARADLAEALGELARLAATLDDALIDLADEYIVEHPSEPYTFHDGPYTITVDKPGKVEVPARKVVAYRDELLRHAYALGLEASAIADAFSVTYRESKTAIAKLTALRPAIADIRDRYTEPARRYVKVSRDALEAR